MTCGLPSVVRHQSLSSHFCSICNSSQTICVHLTQHFHLTGDASLLRKTHNNWCSIVYVVDWNMVLLPYFFSSVWLELPIGRERASEQVRWERESRPSRTCCASCMIGIPACRWRWQSNQHSVSSQERQYVYKHVCTFLRVHMLLWLCVNIPCWFHCCPPAVFV